jgi:CRP-like cAMP-binding protein
MVPVEIIKDCKVFKMFPDSLIKEIASIGTEVKYKVNEMLFNIDEPAENLAILTKGKLELLTTKRTQLIPIRAVYPGEAFGLSSMITGRFVFATRALEDSTICAFPVEKLQKILEKDYKAGYLFIKHIATLGTNRLVRMHDQLDITGPGYA